MKTIAWVKRSGRLSRTHYLTEEGLTSCGRAIPDDLEKTEKGGPVCARCNPSAERSPKKKPPKEKTSRPSSPSRPRKKKKQKNTLEVWPSYKPAHTTVERDELCVACAWAYTMRKRVWLCSTCRTLGVDKIEFLDAGPVYLIEVPPGT